MDTTRLSETICDELRRRYIAKERADAALTDYLLGILHARGIPPTRWVGFDDETGEIMLTPEEVKAPDDAGA